MAILVAFVCGLMLLFYPFWARKSDPRAGVRWTLGVVGLTLLCWCALAVFTTTQEFSRRLTPETWEKLIHLKWIIAGVSIGLVMGLAIRRELLPISRKPVGEFEVPDK